MRESKVRVKVCGITSWGDARLAVDAGADALGFNFFPPSPRYISPAQARSIVLRLPARVETVGIFVNESPVPLCRIASRVGLSLVQLHGDESRETVEDLSFVYPVIKAFRVRRGFRPGLLASYRAAAAFLLDAYRRSLRGGTGRSFDWQVARQAKRYGLVILSGGLTAENVARAIREVEPFAIDVCSGVESKPGKKDRARLRAFMRQVEAAFHDDGSPNLA